MSEDRPIRLLIDPSIGTVQDQRGMLDRRLTPGEVVLREYEPTNTPVLKVLPPGAVEIPYEGPPLGPGCVVLAYRLPED